jgi:predicted transcriptional regulator
VERYLDHGAWLRQNVEMGLRQHDEGQFITHEAIDTRIDRILVR